MIHNLCDFIDDGFDTYRCQKCGLIVFSEDGPPALPCSYTEFDIQELQNIGLGCSNEQILKRYDICTNCEFFQNNVCSQCGCRIVSLLEFKNKLVWKDQECPVGKWGKEV